VTKSRKISAKNKDEKRQKQLKNVLNNTATVMTDSKVTVLRLAPFIRPTGREKGSLF
jgi:hypothetical protein